MKALVHHKTRAVALRKKGLSYNEILKKVPVAKSSLSLWLKDLPLTKSEKLVLRDRLDGNISRGRIKAAAVNHQNRLEKEKALIPEIRKEFVAYAGEYLFQIGVGLYWAEGAKNSGGAMFTNSDVDMVRMMVAWFEKYGGIQPENLRYRLYVHKPFKDEHYECWWAKKIGVPITSFTKVSLKPTSKGVKIRQNYRGCLRIEVPKSANLLLKLKIWAQMLVEYHIK